MKILTTISIIIFSLTLIINVETHLFAKNIITHKDTTEQKKIEPIQNKKEVTIVFSTNMSCESCVKKITENLSYMKGIKKLDVSLEKEKITITYNPKKTSYKAFEDAIKRLGYKAEQVKE